ncbi:MAG: 2'-5' RNA ligase family protein [Candidatus Dojkabacteria bacterium]
MAMNFFLGFFPDENAKQSIRKAVREIGESFDGFDIPVRWIDPEMYQMTVLNLGTNMPFYKLIYYKYKLKPFYLKRFKVRFNTVKLGISRKYKELIYLDLLEGGDEMRKIFLELRNIFNLKMENNFVPHLTLGRVSKDLTNQEYSNLCKDLSRVSKKINVNDIEFYISNLQMVKGDDCSYKVLMNLNELSSIKS